MTPCLGIWFSPKPASSRPSRHCDPPAAEKQEKAIKAQPSLFDVSKIQGVFESAEQRYKDDVEVMKFAIFMQRLPSTGVC
jgi:hypothetical protein